MRAPLPSLTLGIVAALAIGCQGGSTPAPVAPTTTAVATPAPPAPPPTPAPEPGPASGDNWSITLDGYTARLLDPSTAKLTGLQGAIDVSGSVVSATMEIFGSCFSPSENLVRFTGTRDGRDLRMTAGPVSGQMVEIAGTLASDSRSFIGSYLITGGCGAASTGSVTGRRMALGGTWVSSGWVIDGSPVSVTIDLNVADAPNPKGSFELSGRVRGNWDACLTDAALKGVARGRVMFPDFATPDGQTVVAELLAETNDAANEMQTVGVFIKGPCNGRSFGGLFKRR